MLRRYAGRFLYLAAAVGLPFVGTSDGRADPVVPGFEVSSYVTGLANPWRMSATPAGDLFVGRDISQGQIYHVTGPGNWEYYPPTTSTVRDPDTVLYDELGCFGTPGAVLTGGTYNSQGLLQAIQPDGTVRTVKNFGSGFANPCEMAFDRNGRFLIGEHNAYTNILASDGQPPSNPTFTTVLSTAISRAPAIAVDPQNRIWTLGVDGVIRVHAADGTLLDDDFASGFSSSHLTIRFGRGGVWGTTHLYVLDFAAQSLYRFDDASPDPAGSLPKPSPIGTGFNTESTMEFGYDGALYVAENTANGRILRIVPEPTTLGLLATALLLYRRRG